MSLGFRPISEFAVVREIHQTRTDKGLHVPIGAEKHLRKGKVLAIGKGLQTKSGVVLPEFGVGDVVVFSQYKGTELDYGGEKLLMINHCDVVGIMEGE